MPDATVHHPATARVSPAAAKTGRGVWAGCFLLAAAAACAFGSSSSETPEIGRLPANGFEAGVPPGAESGGRESDGGRGERDRPLAGGGRGAEPLIGVVLPLTGDWADLGRAIREGIDVAIGAWNEGAAGDNAFMARVAYEDSGSDPEQAVAALRRLESLGVVAVAGPLREEVFGEVQRMGARFGLPVISPTVSGEFPGGSGVHTIYGLEERERIPAAALAAWAVVELGLTRAGILAPVGPGMDAAADAFQDAFTQAGGQVLARERFQASDSTYSDPIGRIGRAGVDLVFAPAPTTALVLRTAPQLFYFGLHDVVVLGNQPWGDPTVLRRLGDFASDYTVVGLWMDQSSSSTEWERFRHAYENAYDKPLRVGMPPALGYDVARLILESLAQARYPDRAGISRVLAEGTEMHGATGQIVLEPDRASVSRDPQVRMILEGALTEPDPGQILAWLREVRAAPPPLAPRDTVLNNQAGS